MVALFALLSIIYVIHAIHGIKKLLAKLELFITLGCEAKVRDCRWAGHRDLFFYVEKG